ncbi:MAG: BadF/BadG/BcrA/BcrD ATPase family protein [Gemmatimonadaceae bacterium]
MTAIVVGVDGGGSLTRVMVADARGTIIGESQAPGSAIRPGHADHSAEIIAGAVCDALAASGIARGAPAVLCAGVAGAGRDSERQALLQALSDRELASEIIVHADASIALEDAFADGPGVLTIAGTGSVAFGRGPTGAFARCGGWGAVCGDEGSGAWIGRRALSVITAASDGREPETALVAAVLTAVDARTALDVIPWAASATPAALASLAPVVVAVAETGDLRANSILSLAAEELVLHIRTLARILFADERAGCPVALAGGLLAPGAGLRKRVEHRLKTAVPGAQVRTEEVVAVRGAVRCALREMGYRAL